MLKNKYPLNAIYFYLTEGCNLSCRHCWIQPQNNKEPAVLDLGLFKSIIRQGKELGLGHVKLSGGEPSFHPQINEMLDFIKEENLTLTTETNGVLMTPACAEKIISCKNPFVAVSLDATEPKTHEWIRGQTGCFEKTIRGIKILSGAGLKPQIIMTLMQCNKNQIEAMVRLAESLGASSVKFNITQPTARGKQMHEAGETIPLPELVKIGSWIEHHLSTTTKLGLIFSHPVAFRPLGRIYGERGIGCGVCGIFGILGVLANGSYALCGIGENVPEFVFGHAAADELKEIWHNHPTLIEIRKGLPERLEGICKECVMKSRCRGSCIAQNYYSSKNLWAPFWFCARANELGLFPNSRKICAS